MPAPRIATEPRGIRPRRLVQPRCQITMSNDRAQWLCLAAVLAIAATLRFVVVANTDVSWLLTVAEKLLDGQRLYRDVIETNPPIAPLAYLPAVLLGRLLHMRAEAMVDSLVFVALAIAAATALRILRTSPSWPLMDSHSGWLFALFCVAALTVLPMQAFAQREHLALIALLPALAAFVLRARGESLPRRAIIIAGLSSGLMLCFKPYFVIPIGLGIVTVAWQARSWRILFAPEYFVAAAIVALYVVLTLVFFPDYFTQIYPLVRDVYIALPAQPTIGSIGAVIWVVTLALTLARRRSSTDAPINVLIAVSLGFALAYVLQRKGWAYQAYPMLALALIALAYVIARPAADATAGSSLRFARAAGLAVLFVSTALWMNVGSNTSALIAAVGRISRHPKILVLSGEPSIGHPLVRAVDGQWVLSQQALWVKEYVDRLHRASSDPATDARRTADVVAERSRLIEAIKRNPPDVLLVDNLFDDWGDWLRADPELSQLLKPFRPVERVENIDILARAD